jgi:gliding motility-associated-like protein
MKSSGRLFVLFLGLLFWGNKGQAQIVGTDCFLQGNWVEVGINQMGGFGTCTSPLTYHTHNCCWPTVTTFTPGAAMDMSYDPYHDGWSTGTPALMGAYSQPGYPQEGWCIQVGATEYRNGAWGGLCTGEYDIAGTITGYSSISGRMTATWSGSIAGLNIRQLTHIDTMASWIVITSYIYNPTAAPIADVYYQRTLDPDNVSYWGAGPVTRNKILHQNDDPTHRVMVSANGESAAAGTTPAYDSVNSYLALATRDCRARSCVISGLTPTSTPAVLWANIPLAFPPGGSGPVVLGGSRGQTNKTDQGISIVYNLGTIAAGDSTAISYAYVFDRDISIDSAFPDPTIVINGVERPSNIPPTPDYDTFFVCGVPGLVTLPVEIRHGGDGCWTWGKWTWAPATGLSATTGLDIDISIGALSGAVTYTITGTDSAIGMYSCNQKTFYLTVYPCHSASSNSPADSASSFWICEGDTLELYDQGDSLGATYAWHGPAVSPTFLGPIIDTGQYIKRYPTTMADTGWYYVVKTVGGANDTAETRVMIRHRPVITATYGSPLCSGNTLLLYSNPDYVGETWEWRGPAGFTSTLSDPTRPSAPTGFSGVYTVVATLDGCLDSNTINVVVDSTPAVPTASSNTYVCEQDTLKLFSDCATPGVSYLWTGPSGFSSTAQNPVVPNIAMTAIGNYTVTVRLGLCTNTATTYVEIRDKPDAILGSNSPVCSGNSLNLTTTGLPGSTFDWTGPLTFTSTLQYPSVNPAMTANSGTYSVIVTLNGCRDTAYITAVVDTTPETPVISTNSPGPPGATICQGDTLMLFAFSATAGVLYSWTGPNSFSSTEANPMILNATPLASGVYTLVVSVGSCSVTSVISSTVTPTPPVTATSNTPVCSGALDTLMLQATGDPGSSFTWTGPYTFFSNAQNPQRNPVSTEYGGVYHVTVLLDGCTNTVSHTVVVNPTPTPPWIKWLTYCQYYDAPYLQAFGSNILWYTSAAAGGIGSTAPPKPQTDTVGVRFYYVNQTVLNCPSAIDSIRVRVNPTPAVTVSPDETVCPWDSVVLTAVNTDAIAYYKWYPEMYLDKSAGAVVISRPETDIEYMVVTSNMYDCTDTAKVKLTVKANAVVHIRDSVTLYPGETFQIEPATNCTWFSWTPAGGLSSKYISNPVASPEISTKYVVTGMTEWGCKTQDSINVNINTEAILTLPNAFAPGRGVNNLFKVIKRGTATLRHFRVYDRWGVVVFQTSNIDEGWDGTFKGVPQPVGVYIYDVSAVSNTGKEFTKSGNVTLLR